MRTRKQSNDTQPVVVSVAEAARRYDLSERQIRALIHRGTLAAVRPAGLQGYRIPVDALERCFSAEARTG